jgi:uncharacterized membrane protein YfcA
MPHLAPWQWLLGTFCAFMVGVAKTGAPGVGIVSIPLMVLTVGDARLSAGWLLPILCTADVFAVIYWRRHIEARRLFSLAPWVVAGMAAGALALGLSERLLRPAVGVIVLLMLFAHLWRSWRRSLHIESHAAPYGIAAGFATTVANAAGPVMNLYLLSKRLPKEEFVATGAWFYFVINLMKAPIYLWHHLISAPSLLFDLAMAPAVVAGALTGRWVIRLIPQRVFDISVLVLTAVASVLLFR